MTLPRVIRSPRDMQRQAEAWRRDGKKIAVVPTMGYLHDGHVALLRAARARADIVILTIFVNPTQFGPNEDLSRYPRDEAGDLQKAAHAGTDVAFCPDVAAMYPEGSQTFIEIRELQRPLCGASRPGHFAGVATVVAKLFLVTKPHLAFFGEKDFQQLAIIRQMTRDLLFDIEVVGQPIVREPDGLAMSSRNVYLSPTQRAQALALSQALEAVREAVQAGMREVAALVELASARLRRETDLRIDYVEIRDATTLAAISALGASPAVLAVAAFVGTTRLIDNCVLTAAA